MHLTIKSTKDDLKYFLDNFIDSLKEEQFQIFKSYVIGLHFGLQFEKSEVFLKLYNRLSIDHKIEVFDLLNFFYQKRNEKK